VRSDRQRRGYYDAWREGCDPAGISTQDPQLAARYAAALSAVAAAVAVAGLGGDRRVRAHGVSEKPPQIGEPPVVGSARVELQAFRPGTLAV
jgi:hypothetical protein